MRLVPYLFALLGVGITLFAISQNRSQVSMTAQQSVPAGYCLTDQLHQALLAESKAYREQHESADALAYAKMSGNQQKSLPPPYTIPVVFHIVHQGGSENIDDAAVQQSLAYLNAAFANTGYYDQGTGVASQLQFCLAQRTPDNQPTTGINRVESPLTNLEAPAEDVLLKNLSRWEPTEYINIWVVKEICGLGSGCGVAGYAYFPSAHGGLHDGIVVEANWLANNEPAQASVLVHEMGHYLGLYHTFEGGCTNDDCLTDGDRVCDTPPDQSKAAVPCNGTANTCTTDTDSGFATDQNDMFNNYMDYGIWACYNAFTAGQRDRMYTFLEGTRASLLSSPGCLDPCPSPVTAAFIGGDVTVPIGTQVTFTNQSTNGVGYSWAIDGTEFATSFDAAYTFNTLGTFTIELTVSSTDPLCLAEATQQTVTVICPVETSFNGPLVVTPGESATFVETTTGGATAFTWTLNGTVVGNAATLDYTFTQPGLNQLCLQAGNGLCAVDMCQNMVVNNPSGNCDDGTFIESLGDPEQVEMGEVLVPRPDGSMYVGGHTPNAVLIYLLESSGSIVWQRAISLPITNNGSVGALNDLHLAADGDLYGTGFIDDDTGFFAYAFRFDPELATIIWYRQLATNSRGWTITTDFNEDQVLWATDRNQAPAPGNFEDPGFRRLQKSDGSDVGTLNRRYTLSASENFNATVLWNNNYYCVGRYNNGTGAANMRAAFSAFDSDGNEIVSTVFHVPSSQNARLYARDLVIENQAWIATYSGDDNGTSTTATETFLAKGQLDGTLSWLQKYDITEYGNEWVVDMVSTMDGYLLLGSNRSGDRQLFLLKTDKDGVPLWAKAYGGDNSLVLSDFAQKQIQVVGDHIWFIGFNRSVPGTTNDSDIFIFKTDTAGNVADNCLEVSDLTIEYAALPLSQTDVSLLEYPDNDASEALLASVEPYAGAQKNICAAPCDTTDCGSSFAYYWVSPQDGVATTVVSDGNFYYLGGSHGNNGFVAKVDVFGNPQWVRELYPGTGEAPIADLKFDSDGMLIGCGRALESSNAFDAFAFRINPLNGAILWAQRYEAAGLRTTVYNIEEKGPGGDFVLFGGSQDHPGGQGCDADFLEVDRGTGTLLPSQMHYHLGSCETFYDAVYDNGIFYACGRFNFSGGGLNRFRASVTAINESGTPIWSRLYLQNVVTDARLYAMDIVLDNNSLLFAAHGDQNGTQAATNNIYVVRANLAGTAMWGRRYVFPETVTAQEIVVTDDGYLLLARNTTDTRQYLWKINKTGGMVWSRQLDNFRGEGGMGQSLIVEPEHIILATGYVAGAEFPALLRLDLEGLPTDPCLGVADAAISVESITSPYDGFHQLSVYNQPFTDQDFGAEPIGWELLDQSCPLDCTEDEICDNQIDDDGDGLVDCDDPDVQGDCCCYVPQPLDLGPDTLLCPGEVLLLEAGADFIDYTWSTGSNAMEIEVTEAGTYFVQVTDSCDIVLADTVVVTVYIPPVLDLGPDLEVCESKVVVLDAGPAFAEYEWVDGSTEQTYTAFAEGSYWVIATDSCGDVQTDTVSITFDPATEIDLGSDTTLCLGETITFSLTGFTDYQWFPEDIVDCTDCATVTFTPTRDTILYVVAELGLGCLSTDSLSVTVVDAVGNASTALLCTGDTLAYGGQTIVAPGTYLDTAGSTGNCTQIDTLVVQTAPTSATAFDTTVCAGNSILVFGLLRTESGVFTETLDNEAGCDSTHTVTLTVLPTDATSVQLAICAGDTALVFGEGQTQPGLYSELYTNENGCDSLHQIELAVNPVDTTAESLTICAGETALIFGVAEEQPGEYVQVVDNQAGCDSTHTVTLTVLPIDSTYAVESICAGDSILLFGNFETMTGQYTGGFTNMAGCDSTHVIDLTVFPTYQTNDMVALCGGDSVLVFGDWVTQPGDYAMTFATAAGCDSTHTVAVEVSAEVITDEFITICPGGSAVIFGEVETEPGFFFGDFSTVDGCDSLHRVQLSIDDLSVTALQGQQTCTGEAVGVAAAIVTGGVAPFTYSWSNGDTTQIITALAEGPYSVTVTDVIGCTAEATVQIESFQAGDIVLESLAESCAGEADGTILVGASEPGWTYSLDGVTYTAEPFFNDLPPGTYMLWIRDENGCTTQRTITIEPGREVSVILPEDTDVVLGDSLTIVPRVDDLSAILYWTTSAGQSCEDCPTLTVTPTQTTTVLVTAIDSTGCAGSAEMLLRVDLDNLYYIPNSFSPNDDGVNDGFTIYGGPSLRIIRQLQVFDRWGGQVYDKANIPHSRPREGWDGTARQRPLTAGVYVYVAELELVTGQTVIVAGDVLLLR